MTQPLTLRQKFKQCLLSGWLTHPVWQCAAMIMIDRGLEYETSSNKLRIARVENFLRDIGMPPYPHMTVCRYIAVFYPKTSNTLFEKKAALKIFWREKQCAPENSKTLRAQRAYETKKNKAHIFVKARSLSKEHDWKTVK